MKRNNYLMIVMAFSITVWFGCKTTAVKDGRKAFELKQYMVATEMLKKEITETNDSNEKAEKAFLIGECYRLSNQAESAVDNYNSAINFGYQNANVYYYNGIMLKNLEKYEQAIEQFKLWGEKSSADKAKADKHIEGCQSAIKWKKTTEKNKFRVEKMPDINSAASDYSPAIYENNTLVFSSDRSDASGKENYSWTGNKFSDLFISTPDENKDYKAASTFDDIFNTNANEGTPTFNKDFNEMYFTRCEAKEKGDNFCKIYMSKKEGGKWSKPEMLEFFPDSINVGHPRLSPDGAILFLSADDPKGFGGKDLFMCNRDGASWSSPINLGNTINTDGDEMFPYLHIDNSFYFASNGHPGMGGLDNFFSTMSGTSFTVPENLRHPMNSGADDFGIILEEFEIINKSGFYENLGYFASTRTGGKGNDDIYRFIVEKPAFFALDIIVLEKVFANPDDPNSKVVDYKRIPTADVQLFNIDDKGTPVLVENFKSDDQGEVHTKVDPNTDYRVFGAKTDYLAKSEEISTKGLKGSKNMAVTLTVEVILDKVYTDREIVLNNIYYDLDKSNIRADAAKVLDTLTILLTENPGIKIEIGSHTDSRASTAYNEKLSQARAESVVKYLVSRGIAKDRMTAKGYGESRLVNKCKDGVKCTEEEHQRNRRTTFRILSGSTFIESLEPENIEVDKSALEKEKKGLIKEDKLIEKEPLPQENKIDQPQE